MCQTALRYKIANRKSKLENENHSHSIVLGGLLEMS
jgi:hypothetical protein